jgi:hypothetical protein
MSAPAVPPPIIDSARVLAYAHVEAGVEYTERIHLIVGGERLGRVPCLAICRNYSIPDHILLLFCDSDWNSLGCIAFKSVEEAKIRAERGYAGVTTKWQDSPHNDAATADFLRDVYEVDPSSEWWRHRCSFCQKEVEGQCIAKGWATICVACVDAFHHAMHADS